MKENFMEKNMSATVFDANAHYCGYRKMWGRDWNPTYLKSIESDLIDFSLQQELNVPGFIF